MPIVVSPPPPKKDQKFDDWMYLFWKRVFQAQGGALFGPFTENAIVVADSTSSFTSLADTGTSSQVLIGNASGVPSWSDIAANDVVFTFQVGILGLGHIHYAHLLRSDVEYLIHNTDSTINVGEVSQPSVTITTEVQYSHDHTLTVYFDHVNSSWYVSNITNNGSDNHSAIVISALHVADSAGAVRVDADNPALIYRGTAETGSAESSAVWTISKIVVYGADQVAVSQAAGLNAWDDRATLTYV